MRTKPVKVIFVVLLLGMGSAVAADECVERTERALAELKLVFPGMDEAQTADAERILAETCAAPGSAATQARGATAQAQSDTPSVLGVEFNKAEPDSKGHSRLKKTH
jgi:hypothetical protein